MSAPLLQRLAAETALRHSSMKRNERNEVLFKNLYLQDLAEQTAAYPNPMIPPAPSYHDLSQMLNEMSDRERDPTVDAERATNLLLSLTNGSRTAAQSLVGRMTKSEIGYLVELNVPFFQHLRAKIGNQTLTNATFLSVFRGYLKGIIDDRRRVNTAIAESQTTDVQAMQVDDAEPVVAVAYEKAPDPKPTRTKGFPKKNVMSKELWDYMATDRAFQAQAKKDFAETIGRDFTFYNFDKFTPAGIMQEQYKHYIWKDGDGNVDEPNDEDAKLTGSGLPRIRPERRVIRGRGATDVSLPGTKYYLVKPQLKRGILEVKYATTNQSKIKQMSISRACADVIDDIVSGTFKDRHYNALTEDEKMDVQFFLSTTGLDDTFEIDRTLVDKLYERFQVLTGEIQAGNNNPKIATELRTVILKCIHYRRISRSQGQMYLDDLANYRV